MLYVEVTEKLLLKNMFFQKTNILSSDHKITCIQSTSSQQNIAQTGVIEEVISSKLSKLRLSLTNKKQRRSIKASSRQKKTLQSESGQPFLFQLLQVLQYHLSEP